MLRGVERSAVAGGSGLGALVLAGCLFFPVDSPPLMLMRLALVLLAAAAGFVLDEPAAAAVDAVPRSRRRRTVARVPAAAVPFGVWVVGMLALELRMPVIPAAALVVEGAGVLAAAVALAAVLRLAGRPEPGELVGVLVAGAVLGAIVLDLARGVLLFPWDAGWAASTVLWVCVTVVSAAGVVVASRDPYRRRHVLRSAVDAGQPQRSPTPTPALRP
jgi:hypothetical protein